VSAISTAACLVVPIGPTCVTAGLYSDTSWPTCHVRIVLTQTNKQTNKQTHILCDTVMVYVFIRDPGQTNDLRAVSGDLRNMNSVACTCCSCRRVVSISQ